MLNATRRFRYTANVKAQDFNVDRNKAAALKFRTGGYALLAVHRFKQAGDRARLLRANLEKEAPYVKQPSLHGFHISAETLVLLHEGADTSNLEALGGVSGLAKGLRTDIRKGIPGTEEDLRERREKYGENKYAEKAQKSFWVFVWEACQDTTLIILMVCAVVSLIAGEAAADRASGWYDGVGIGVAVIVVVLITAISDYRQSLQFRDLQAEKDNIMLDVVRVGRRSRMSIHELVVGDIVVLSIGDQIPADGVLVEGHSVSIDESSMTGESHPMSKGPEHPFLLSGCKVVDGFGSMMITGVGINTEWGKIMATVSEDDVQETPLQVRLNGVASFIGKVGLAVAVLVFVILIIRYFANYKSKSASQVIKDLTDIFSIAVTIVVVAVPEGLPLAVTLTLAYSMRKMMADKALVRQLAACETMGSATTICSDKTGTLTLNQMTVVRAWTAGVLDEAEVVGKISKGSLETLLEGIAQNSSGSVYLPEAGGQPEVNGSPTEKAILSFGLQLGMSFDAERAKSQIVEVETFNSAKKCAGVAVKRCDGTGIVHWKGAAEIILDKCTQWEDSNGEAHLMSQEKRAELLALIENMAQGSLRCIGFGYRILAAEEVPKEVHEDSRWHFPEDDLIFLALAGIKDPCRPGVPEAVARCQVAGVKVRMVTGDNLATARAIAGECGILTPDGVLMEGRDFRALSPADAMALIPRLDVLARSSPTDKHTLVKLLRQMGEVVAVTGDGTNDAPALHEADIGLSMGITGTEVAKESSDIVILDDNFASIVKVVRWGRSVYANIQKFIVFQLTVNVGALVINFVAACSNGTVPLTAVQLLWVNLIMDTLGALALATEPPTDDLLLQKPVGRKEPLITNIMWRNLFGQATYQLAVLLTLNFAGRHILKTGPGPHGDRVNKTVIFNSFVFCQLFNELNSRHLNKFNVFTGILTNKLFCAIIVLTVVFQIIIVEFLTKFASTTKLKWQYWLISVIIGAISLPLAILIKMVPVPEKPFLEIIWPRRRRAASTPAATASARRDVEPEVELRDVGSTATAPSRLQRRSTPSKTDLESSTPEHVNGSV